MGHLTVLERPALLPMDNIGLAVNLGRHVSRVQGEIGPLFWSEALFPLRYGVPGMGDWISNQAVSRGKVGSSCSIWFSLD